MTTSLNSATPARNAGVQQIHVIRSREITFADNAQVIRIGTVPAGSLIMNTLSGVHVSTVFNAGTNNFIDIGTTADDDLYGTDVSLLALGLILMDEAETAAARWIAADTTFTCTPSITGTAPTTGLARVVICYIPPNG
jgi:hypothetical protein